MMRSVAAILLCSVFLGAVQTQEAPQPTPAPARTKDALRQRIAELKLKAFEIQTQVELLEHQLRDVEYSESLQVAPAALKSAAPVKTRCAGHTKDGKRCSRNAEVGSRFCWQHKSKR